MRFKTPILLALTTFPIAVLVGGATATMDGFLGALICPAAPILGAFFGAWAATIRDGFAGGFIAGWAGFFLGTLVGIPIQYGLHPDAGWTGYGIALFVGAVGGAVLGILLGLPTGSRRSARRRSEEEATRRPRRAASRFLTRARSGSTTPLP